MTESSIPLQHYLEELPASQIDTESKLRELEKSQSKIKADRDRAMIKAGEPFNQKIAELQAQATQLKSRDLSSILRSPILSENVQIAMEIEAHHTYGTVDGLIDDYDTYLKDGVQKKRHNKAALILARIAQYEAFMNELKATGEPVPFVAASLQWSEVRDAQADDEGKDSSTGVYVRTGSVLTGTVASEDIIVRKQYDEHDCIYNDGVDIAARNLMHVETQLDWMYWEETTEKHIGHTALTLFGSQTGNSFGGRQRIDWDMTNQSTLPQPEFVYRPGYLPNGFVREHADIIAWSDGADRLVDQIISDNHMTRSMIQALGKYSNK